MASITSLMNSNTNSTSSLYGNRNIISGLASGMDTEAMIENSISGYKTKINTLQQKMTKLQWKQDAYRSLISQMNSVLNKYASYTSSTNLFSSSFFSKAVSTVANGANASKVSVTGKGTSNVQIDRIKQLAQAASYKVDVSSLAAKGAETTGITWDKPIETSNVSGSMTLKIGGLADESKASSLTIRFTDDQVFKTADELADAINEQLGKQQIGSSAASDKVEATVLDGRIILQEKGTANNGLRISSASGGLKELFGSTDEEGKTTYNLTSRGFGNGIDEVELVNSVDRADYLKDQTISFTLDGKTKTFKLGDIIDDSFKDLTPEEKSQKLAEGLQKKVNEAFGTGKVTVSNENGALQFTSNKEGSVLKVAGNDAVNEVLGLGKGGYSNVLQNGWSLERILGAESFSAKTNENNEYVDAKGNVVAEEDATRVATLTINGEDIELSKDDTVQTMMDKINSSKAGVNIKYSTLTGEFSMTAKETGVDSKIKIEGELGEALLGAPKDISDANFAEAYDMRMRPGESEKFDLEFKFSGSTYTFRNFTISAEDTIQSVIDRLNDRPLVRDEHFSFNQYTGQIEYTDQFGETSSAIKITDKYGFDYKLEGDYAPKGKYTAGQDAVFSVTVNGKQMDMTRSTNEVELDGYNVTLKGAFGYDKEGNEIETEAITFQTNTDTDKIVNAIKDFVKDYNEMVTAIHSAYTTEPLQNTKKQAYEPLTDDDQASMSETAIKNYEEKAKTGLLYADSDLSNLYSKLTSAIQGGMDSSTLRSIGLNITYENRLTTIDLDEDALRSALESDPDKVKEVFTKTTSGGAENNGLMYNIRSTLQQYGNTSIGSPGILVNKAGTTLSSYSLNNNELNDQINALQKEIEKWQDRMSDRVDYYTNQFTRLEVLINQMNSQSSMLASLSGGM